MTGAAPPKTRPLVVVIDDDPSVLSALRRLLEDEPYDVVTTTDPDAAIELVRTRDVHVLLADYRMPVLSGTGLLQVVKASSPSTVRVLITAYPQSTWVIRALEMEVMEEIVEKPWDEDRLKRTIRSRIFGDGSC